MTSSEAPKVLTEHEPECAPMIGRPTRPHAQHLTNNRRGRKQEEAIKTVYIHAETRIALECNEAKLLNVAPEEIVYAHRRAITAAVIDLFGNISGAPTLNFVILKCERLIEKEKKDELRFELIIGVPKSQVNNMITALSMITARFCGGTILSLFVESNTSAENRASAKLMVDVLGSADFLTNLVTAF
ncbi:unnamed protein product [Hymenolepis diminuta]|uniref:EKC/KEOPS complex subunit cgi121 n=1 Tax=Hymenolepis diminuta TaxID=6216 RepID=A0A0R3SD81_HYMDI|nr:unnamed protein product [Hymenolepis diminuta]VUZ53332.1 unnamed protein product [Hymenolepis diminuta]